MHIPAILLAAGLFASAKSQFVNIYPSIVQLVAEGSPTQTFKNTAGTSNLLYLAAVSANEGRDNEDDWIFNNRVFTNLVFEGIPPFATTCELRISIPPDILLWQVAVYTNGAILGPYNPGLLFFELEMPLSQSSTWTWETLAQYSPGIVNGENGALNGAYFSPDTLELLYPQFPCPGVSGPTGGVIGYTFAIANDIPYSAASVFLNQDYSDPSNLVGIYLRYSTV